MEQKAPARRHSLTGEESSYVLSDVVRGNKSVNVLCSSMAPFAARGLCNFIHKILQNLWLSPFILFASAARLFAEPKRVCERPDNVISNQPKSANDYHRASPLYVTELQMKVTLGRPLAPGPPRAELRFVPPWVEKSCSVSRAFWI